MTSRQLRRWLMREVHGVVIPRKRSPKNLSALGPRAESALQGLDSHAAIVSFR